MFNAAEFAAVFREMRKRDFAEGETLYAQGDAGDSMFICVEGLLASAITVRGQGEVKVETLRAGQHFGEAPSSRPPAAPPPSLPRPIRSCTRSNGTSLSRCSMCGDLREQLRDSSSRPTASRTAEGSTAQESGST